MMKTRRKWIMPIVVFCVLSSFLLSLYAFSAETETETENAALSEKEEQGSEGKDDAEKAEWTVMLYLCGTDLESMGGMASKKP